MSKHVLVTYGSSRGGTAGIAQAIADAMRADGCTVDCKPADEVESLGGYDGVVIGGALYMGRWHRDAWRFCRQHEERLRELPVWLFSSGPLDDSASSGDISPTGQVARLMTLIGARGHITFGGRLERDAKGFIAASMAKTRAGDWRDWAQIGAWACEIATQVQLDEQAPPVLEARRPHRDWWLFALTAFTAISAFAGGGALIARPDGSALGADVSLLSASGFSTFLVPGVLLVAVVGGLHALAAVLVAARARLGSLAAFTAGIAVIVWIICELILLRETHPLQLLYAGVGVVVAARAFGEAVAASRASADRSNAYAT